MIPEENTNPIFMSRRFNDFDEMVQTLHAWNLDIIQLGRGRFRGDVFQLGTARVLISKAVFNRSTWQRGFPPTGYRTFAFLTDPVPHMIWRKQRVSLNTVMAFPPGGELDAVVRKGAFKVYTLSFSEEILADTCRSMALPDLKDLLRNNDVVQVDPTAKKRLIEFLHRICREYKTCPLETEPSFLQQILEVEVTRRFLAVLASSRINDTGTSVFGRKRISNRLENIIERIPHELPTVRDLCRTAEVSERTLQYFFRDRFGITPASYLKKIRLNGARRELYRSDSHATKITDVAARWGFRHMGQFATDYRMQFGELPSATIGRTFAAGAPTPPSHH